MGGRRRRAVAALPARSLRPPEGAGQRAVQRSGGVRRLAAAAHAAVPLLSTLGRLCRQSRPRLLRVLCKMRRAACDVIAARRRRQRRRREWRRLEQALGMEASLVAVDRLSPVSGSSMQRFRHLSRTGEPGAGLEARGASEAARCPPVAPATACSRLERVLRHEVAIYLSFPHPRPVSQTGPGFAKLDGSRHRVPTPVPVRSPAPSGCLGACGRLRLASEAGGGREAAPLAWGRPPSVRRRNRHRIPAPLASPFSDALAWHAAAPSTPPPSAMKPLTCAAVALAIACLAAMTTTADAADAAPAGGSSTEHRRRCRWPNTWCYGRCTSTRTDPWNCGRVSRTRQC